MAVVPLKITVLVFAVNVPLLIQFPCTVNVFELLIVTVAHELIVNELQIPSASPIVG